MDIAVSRRAKGIQMSGGEFIVFYGDRGCGPLPGNVQDADHPLALLRAEFSGQMVHAGGLSTGIQQRGIQADGPVHVDVAKLGGLVPPDKGEGRQPCVLPHPRIVAAGIGGQKPAVQTDGLLHQPGCGLREAGVLQSLVDRAHHLVPDHGRLLLEG